MGLGKLGDDATVTRSMSNLLTPLGLVPKRLYLQRKSGHFPHAHRDPMPHQSGAFIETKKGVRCLTADELARGLGILKGADQNLREKPLKRTTSLFRWEYLSYSLQPTNMLVGVGAGPVRILTSFIESTPPLIESRRAGLID